MSPGKDAAGAVVPAAATSLAVDVHDGNIPLLSPYLLHIPSQQPPLLFDLNILTQYQHTHTHNL